MLGNETKNLISEIDENDKFIQLTQDEQKSILKLLLEQDFEMKKKQSLENYRSLNVRQVRNLECLLTKDSDNLYGNYFRKGKYLICVPCFYDEKGKFNGKINCDSRCSKKKVRRLLLEQHFDNDKGKMKEGEYHIQYDKKKFVGTCLPKVYQVIKVTLKAKKKTRKNFYLHRSLIRKADNRENRKNFLVYVVRFSKGDNNPSQSYKSELTDCKVMKCIGVIEFNQKTREIQIQKESFLGKTTKRSCDGYCKFIDRIINDFSGLHGDALGHHGMSVNGKDEYNSIYFMKDHGKYSLDEYLNNFDLRFPMKLNVVKMMVQEVCDFHKKWYVHRDIKPGNFFLDSLNEIKLGDLCDAKLCGDRDKKRTGTFIFCAPEVLEKFKKVIYRAHNENVITQQSDIFSLGVSIMVVLLRIKHFPVRNFDYEGRERFLNDNFTKLKVFCRDNSCVEIFNMVERMLNENPKSRPNSFEVEKFFKKIKIMDYSFTQFAQPKKQSFMQKSQSFEVPKDSYEVSEGDLEVPKFRSSSLT